MSGRRRRPEIGGIYSFERIVQPVEVRAIVPVDCERFNAQVVDSSADGQRVYVRVFSVAVERAFTAARCYWLDFDGSVQRVKVTHNSETGAVLLDGQRF